MSGGGHVEILIYSCSFVRSQFQICFNSVLTLFQLSFKIVSTQFLIFNFVSTHFQICFYSVSTLFQFDISFAWIHFQLCFNSVSTSFQLSFKFVSTHFQLYSNSISNQFQLFSIQFQLSFNDSLTQYQFSHWLIVSIHAMRFVLIHFEPIFIINFSITLNAAVFQ